MSDVTKGPATSETATSRRAFMGSAASLGVGLGLAFVGARRAAQAQATAPRSGKAKILKFGSLGTDIHPATISARAFGELVSKRTNGGIEVQVFPSAQLGGEREVAEGMLLGSVQGSALTLAVLGGWVPEGQLFELPFLFRDDQHALSVMAGPLADELAEKFPAKGFRVLGFPLGGIRHLMSKFPIHLPADIKGRKMRTIQSPLHITLWQTLGAIPTPLPPGEIYGGMQTGVIDFFDNAKSSYWDMKWYEVAPYVTELGPHGITANVIAPGFIRTPALEAVLSTDRLRALAGQVPVGRIGEPAEIAAAVAFLASDEASYVNGAVLDINGGRMEYV